MSNVAVTKGVKIFYCYARKDKNLRDKLAGHLASLQRTGQVISWYDREILPGTEWELEIQRHLDTSDIVLLLISSDFVRSDYCYSVEMQQALARHNAGATSVIPIILRPCSWKELPMGALQALPEGGKPITRWRNRDEAFLNVVVGIQKVVETRFAQKAEQVNTGPSFQAHQNMQIDLLGHNEEATKHIEELLRACDEIIEQTEGYRAKDKMRQEKFALLKKLSAAKR